MVAGVEPRLAVREVPNGMEALCRGNFEKDRTFAGFDHILEPNATETLDEDEQRAYLRTDPLATSGAFARYVESCACVLDILDEGGTPGLGSGNVKRDLSRGTQPGHRGAP